MLPFRMARLQFSKCIGDKVRVVLVRDLRAMLQAQGTMHLTKNAKECLMEKILLVQAHESGQTDDLYAFDSDCDEAPSAKAVLRAYLSSYDLDVISEVPISDIYPDNFVLDHYVQEMYYR
uniref:Uncharacterized protein n=1 Tax=Tanacetum cinerariifolium TaxID=118510 RepID=A0A699IGQ6_TANCI|nr:hypothetical protein [Tanacetum cinerariifolium]